MSKWLASPLNWIIVSIGMIVFECEFRILVNDTLKRSSLPMTFFLNCESCFWCTNSRGWNLFSSSSFYNSVPDFFFSCCPTSNLFNFLDCFSHQRFGEEGNIKSGNAISWWIFGQSSCYYNGSWSTIFQWDNPICQWFRLYLLQNLRKSEKWKSK